MQEKETEDVVSPGLYKHFKGHLCEVLGVGRHSETLELMVVYRHDSKEYGEQALWVRPLAMFKETVMHEGKEVPRFKRINP